MKVKRYAIFTLFLLIPLLCSAHVDEYRLHSYIVSLKESSPPTIWQGVLIFTYQSENHPRYVGIAFEHEKYSQIYTLKKNSNDVFFFVMDIPLQEEIHYRMVVDGVWINDPRAYSITETHNGQTLSSVQIPEVYRRGDLGVEVLDDQLVKFSIEQTRGRSVYLTGSFNSWDPYMYRLEEQPVEGSDKSLYTLTLRLSRGRHTYYYFIDGKKSIDPENADLVKNRFGETASQFSVLK